MTALKIRAVPSPLPVATRAPSGLNATAYTSPLWLTLASSDPVTASKIRAVPSPLPVATRAPSGLNATAYTSPLWLTLASSDPVTALKIRAVPSPLPVATRAPSGLNATAYTSPSCGIRTSCRTWPAAAGGVRTRTSASLVVQAR